MNPKNISVIILTRNEERHIRDCVKNASPAGQVLVFDSGSIDATRQTAVDCGADVIQHPFVDFADQRNAAMRHANKPWIFFIDADERISPELWNEIGLLPDEEPSVYAVPRHNYFFGKRMKHGGNGDDFQQRLFPREGVVWEQPVHEKIASNLPKKILRCPLLHYSTRDLTHYREKAACYIPLEVQTMIINGRVANRLDLIFRPIAKFILLYLCKCGFLDGFIGFQYAWLSAGYDYEKYRRFLAKRTGKQS